MTEIIWGFVGCEYVCVEKKLLHKILKNMKQLIFTRLFFSLSILLLSSKISYSQNPACSPTTPYFLVNLTGQPAGVWSSPNISRNSQCCGAPNSDACISFDVILDPNSAGIQIDMVGADPAGSLFYSIGCAGSYPGGTIKCITGVGPHRITFCKPGNNKNIYTITSIAKPTFPPDQHVRIGCVKELTTLGIVNNSATWQSIFPGTSGAYDSYLSCTNCASPNYTPASNAPAYVEYRVCGFPQASTCGYNFTVCDTVRIYNDAQLTGSVTPNPATFCNIGPGSGVTLTATGTGGLAPYTYKWRNSSNVVVGTNATYFATAAGNYTVEIGDALNSPTCPSYFQTVVVNVGQLPIVNAGLDQTLCASSPTVNLSGTVQNATGGVWSGGTGTFNPGNTFLNTLYTPSAAEILAGSVTLTLTSSGAGGGCTNSTDQVTITFSPIINVTIPPASLGCNGNSTTLTANVTGGTAPLTYQWNNGATSNSIVASQGNYTVLVTDIIGCTGTGSYNLIAPSSLGISFNTTDVTVNGGSNGTASVVVTGGTAPYTYLWSNGGTGSSISGQPYGLYTVTVTDASGCVISGSVVINEPRCAGFNVNASSTNVSCYGNNNGTGNSIVVGGTPPYSYSWNSSPIQTTANASNLPAGVYTIAVTDSNSCVQTANIVITEPTILTNVMNQANPTTIGGTNGSASANPFGGTAPYSYLWNTGVTTSAITNVGAGIYTVTITDFNGCTKVDSVLLIEPPCNHIALSVVTTNVACFSGSTGSALAILTNATPPYTISWSNGQVGPTASNLPAGNYTVTINDANNCSLFRNFSITQPSQLSSGLSINPISCNGANDATIDLNVSGGVFPYSFNWNNGATSEDLVNIGSGNIVVIITDQNGCSVSSSTTITQPTALAYSYTVQKPTCIFGSDGSIDLTVSGGVLPYTYNWSNTASTQDVSGIQAGGYSVSLNDANGCTNPTPILISVLQPDSVIISSHTVACSTPGSGVSLVTVVPAGGNSGLYQVSFDNGITYQTAGDYDALLPNGATYSVWVKDHTGCISLVVYTIEVKPNVVISSVNFANCFALGTTTTNVTITVSGGDNGPYSISYDGGATYQTVGTLSFNLAVGTSYSIIAKDARGCISVTYNISIPTVLTVDATITSNYFGVNVSCNGASDGSASSTVVGGTAPYSYSWNSTPIQITSFANNLSAGTYTVTVTDGNGCTRTDNISLTEPSTITSTAAIISNYNGQNISCNGANNGTALVTPTGGTAPYTYSWNTSPIQTSVTANGLGANTYTAIVTDVNGCSSTSTVTLTEPIILSSTTSIISNYNGQNISCNGANDGSALASVTGGTPPYSYSWSTSPTQISATATNIGASTYIVNVTDVNGCTTSSSIALTEPPVLSSSAIASSNYNGFNISCHGLNDGAIDMTTIGGTSPYQFSWNNGGTTEDLSNLTAGNYSATITDINGCSTTASATLIEADSVLATINVLSNYNGFGVSCFNFADGTIDINVSGGTSTYTYLWSNGATTQDVTSLITGSYLVTVSDANNCTDTMTTVLTQPTALNIVIDSISNYNGFNVSCFNSTDGFINLTTSGGVSPYNFLWNNNATTEDISNIPYGGYLITLSDLNNCVLLLDTTLIQPTDLMAIATATSSFGIYNVSCYGSTNGTADLTVTGGLTPYIYSWSTSETTEDVTGLGAGTYSVTVTDLNGCIDSTTATITQPDSLIANINAVSNYNGFSISCNGASNGSIDVGVNGGMVPYTYAWSNGSSTQDIQLVGPGNYTLVVTDLNGCTDTISATLIEPTILVATIDSISNYNGFGVSCNTSSNGNVFASVTGGAAPYIYLWNNGATTEDISNVPANSYVLNVTDLNGCLTNSDTTLLAPPALTNTFTFVNPGCNGLSNGSINVTLTGGVTPYSYNWNNGATTEDLVNIPIGTYSLVYNDLNGCFDSISVTLIEPQVLNTSYIHQNIFCFGGNNGLIDLNITGGTLPYTYLWSNGSTEQDVDTLTQGTYFVTITDAQGCSKTDTIVVSQPNALVLTLDSPILPNGHNISFYQGADGSIDLAVNGGTLPYSYLWSTTETTEDITELNAGQYSVVVTDANGCSTAGLIILSQPSDLTMPTGITPNGDGKNDNFVIKGIEAYPNNVLTIYNRWGNIVYKRAKYLNEWAGTNMGGEELPEGTYFAVLEINGRDITLNGYVEIRRK